MFWTQYDLLIPTIRGNPNKSEPPQSIRTTGFYSEIAIKPVLQTNLYIICTSLFRYYRIRLILDFIQDKEDTERI